MTEEKITEIKIEIDQIKKDMLEIKALLKTINKNIKNDVVTECQRMGLHINFIENIYEKIKNPIWYICNKMNTLSLSSPPSSPNSSDNKIYTLDNNKTLHINYIN